MKPSVRRALEAVASASDTAAALAKELSTSSNDARVQELTSQVIALQAQVSLMRMAAAHNEELLNEGEVVLMREQFLHHLSSVQDNMLGRQFDRHFFEPHTNQVRVVLARALINDCYRRKINANSFWVDIVASNGEL